jgi:hypothetical protein
VDQSLPMRSSLFLVAAVLLIPLSSCAPDEGVDGDPEGTYSLAIQGHIISSSDAIQLMSDKTGIFQYNPQIIAHYGNREPRHSPTIRRGYSLSDVTRNDILSSENMAHVLQLVDKLVNARAPTVSDAGLQSQQAENSSAILRSMVQVHL